MCTTQWNHFNSGLKQKIQVLHFNLVIMEEAKQVPLEVRAIQERVFAMPQPQTKQGGPHDTWNGCELYDGCHHT